MAKKVEQVELLLNCFQAMNYFKLSGRNRRVAEKKFKDKFITTSEWETSLKEAKLLI